MRVHRAAAAFAAVADSIKALQHGILEEGVMHVSTLVFGFQDVDGFFAGDEA